MQQQFMVNGSVGDPQFSICVAAPADAFEGGPTPSHSWIHLPGIHPGLTPGPSGKTGSSRKIHAFIQRGVAFNVGVTGVDCCDIEMQSARLRAGLLRRFSHPKLS